MSTNETMVASAESLPEAKIVEPRTYIYDTIEEAKAGCAFSDRARVYKVSLPGKPDHYVSDINPLTAVGRVAQKYNILAEPLGGGNAKVKDADDLMKLFESLSDEEKAKFKKISKKS